MGCGTATIKLVIFIFNIAFVIGGLSILITAAGLNYSIEDYSELLEEESIKNVPSTLLTFVACAIFIIAILGCCGSIQESYYMLLAFTVLLLVIFVTQIVCLAQLAGISVDSELKAGLMKSFKNYDTNEKYKTAWNEIQMDLDCCGLDNSTDWQKIENISIPDSCKCEGINGTDFNSDDCSENGIYTTGCVESLSLHLGLISLFFGVFIIIVMLFEIVGITFGTCLLCAIKQNI